MRNLTFTYKQLGHFGALGNQLWEIASTYGISKSVGGSCVFPEWQYAKYFNIPDELFVTHDQLPLELDLSGNYLQNYEYHDMFFKQIKSWFSPAPDVSYRISYEFPQFLQDFTAVHVRRANNLNLPNHHPVQPIEYYERALDMLSYPRNLIVFSDDLDWCRSQPLFENAIFGMENDRSIDVMELTGAHPVTLDTVAIDLLAMAKCKNFVISNSTFSWWSAYLSDSHDVIYPLNWYGPMVSADYTLMIDKGWGWKGI